MKALSIKQPWAYAIMYLGKNIENRGWFHRFKEQTRIAVHASAGMTKLEYNDAHDFMLDIDDERNILPPDYALDRGCIVGTVLIIGLIDIGHSSPWWVGPKGYLLDDPVPINPIIPVKGKLGFWDVPDELIFNVCRRCGRSRDGHALAQVMHEDRACEEFIGEYEC